MERVGEIHNNMKIQPEQILIALIRGFKAVVNLLERVLEGEDISH